MKAKFLILIILILGGKSDCFSQLKNNPLSKKEKISDFQFLFQEFQASYPYFEINQRLNGTQWLSNKSFYLEKISETKNDRQFFSVLTEILNDLNNGHTDFYPTIIFDYFYKTYNSVIKKYPEYQPYLNELKKTDSTRCKYWANINKELIGKNSNEAKKKEGNKKKENITTNLFDSESIATISIRSFNYDLISQDEKKLKSFFSKANQYRHLIIDIQGNHGGDTSYWMEHIVPHLISDSIVFPMNYAFKKSERLKYFKPSYFLDTIDYKKINLPNFPEEIKNPNYLFRSTETIILPNPSSEKYNGNIYLLVDRSVFSSAETLAYFCKATKFAKVVGEQTNGDGIGTDPLLITLPNSGIVIRFTGEMGLNPDGSANEEMKTMPDLEVKAANPSERLDKLLQILREKE